MSHKRWKTFAILVGAAAAAIQLMPYGREHTNPPSIVEPRWDSGETRELARRACFDCHSNETTWPAYSRVAPVSWLVYHDVVNGRSELNFSEWQRPQKEAHEAPDVVGEMPPLAYRLMHGSARLSADERAQLARGLARTSSSEQGARHEQRRSPTNALLWVSAEAAPQTPHHEFSVTARRYAFEPVHLEVHSGDLVKITLRSEDIAHSFVVDAYRISKRVSAGGMVTFEFLADRAGTFPFYCNLTMEEGCREMKGQLVVLR
jgi:plastocyanin